MTVARENRDNPLLRTTMLIRCTYIYIYIYLYRRLSTLQLRHIYAYGNISEICAHVRILRVSRNFFFLCSRISWKLLCKTMRIFYRYCILNVAQHWNADIIIRYFREALYIAKYFLFYTLWSFLVILSPRSLLLNFFIYLIVLLLFTIFFLLLELMRLD